MSQDMHHGVCKKSPKSCKLFKLLDRLLDFHSSEKLTQNYLICNLTGHDSGVLFAFIILGPRLQSLLNF